MRAMLRLVWLPITVFLVGLAITAAFTVQFGRVSDGRDRERFERLAEAKLVAMRDRLETHISLLRGTAGLFAASDDVSRGDFENFVERLRIQEAYPGAQGIGFARRFDAAQRAQIAETLQAQHARPVTLRPQHERADHTAVMFLEPLDRRNETAIGYDMFTDATRRAAMERARDTGAPAMSGLVELVQEIDRDKQPGFLIYLPVYSRGDIPQTLEERRERLAGWAYSPFRAYDLFTRGLGEEDGQGELSLSVFDGDVPAQDSLLIRSAPSNIDQSHASVTASQPIEVAGRRWSVAMTATPAFDRDSNRRLVPYILGSGVAITLMLAGAALLQANASRSAEAAREDLRTLNAVLETRVVERTADLGRTRDALQKLNLSLEDTVAERTADLTEANQEIQRFAYIVSHDLRSPLVNIMGFTAELEVLGKELRQTLAELRGDDAASRDQDQAAAQDFNEALGFIKASIGKMDRLINAILRLSREGSREFKSEPIDMTGLVESIVSTVAHQAAEADATVSVGPLPPLSSDRLALEQVFSNLVDNALKYLRRDEPGRIEITGRRTPGYLVYEVVDNGRGIDPKDHQRIFELFRRAGAQDRPGEGIGLAHVRALVRRLGGTMTVSSELGRGSVFTVSLPQRWLAPRERSAA